MAAASATIGLLRGIVALDASGFKQGARETVNSTKLLVGGFDGAKAKAVELAAEIVNVTGLLNSAGDSLIGFGKKWTLGFTVPVGGAAGVALKFATDFEAAITKLGTLSDVSTDQLGMMRQAVLDLAPTVGIGPVPLAEALLAVTSTGLRSAQALEVLENAAKASAIGLGDTRDIASALTSVMNAYAKTGLTAAQATDILVQSVVEGKAEASEFAPVIGRVVGLAAKMGVSFQEVGAFVATFTRLGVDADEAVTALRGTLSNFLGTTPAVQKALQGVGLSLDSVRSSIRERGLTTTLIDLIERFKGNDAALSEVIPNVRALAGVFGTAGVQGEQFREVLTKIEASQGVTAKKFKEASLTTAFALATLAAKAKAVATEFGGALAPSFNSLIEAARPLLDLVAGLLRVFTALPQPVQTTAIAFVALGVAMGPVLIGFGALLKVLALMAQLAALNSILKILTGQATATAVASTGLGAALAGLRGWVTKVATATAGFVRSFLSIGSVFRVLSGLVTGSIGLFVRLGGVLLGMLNPASLVVGGLLLLATTSATARGAFSDIISIIGSLIKILYNLARDGIGLLVDGITLAIAQLRELKKWAEDNIPGFVALEKIISGAAESLHNAAIAMKEVADASKVTLPSVKGLTNSVDAATQQFEDRTRAMQESVLADEYSRIALINLTKELKEARVKALGLTDAQKNYLTAAIAEGSTTIEDMATAARTTTGAVKTFKDGIDEARQTAEKATNKFKELRDALSGKDALDEAKSYERALKAIGGATKLTKDEAEDYIRVFDAVIAKYRQFGPAGASVVAHFQTLRDSLGQTDAVAQQYLENELRGFEASKMALEDKDKAAQEYLDSELLRAQSLDLIAQDQLDAEKRGADAYQTLLDAKDDAAREFMQAELARMQAFKGTQLEDPFTKEMERRQRAMAEFVGSMKQHLGELRQATLGQLGTVLFGLGHDLTGELRRAAEAAEQEYLKIKRSGKATAKEVQLAFERFREAEERASFTFGERMKTVWLSIKKTIVDVLNDVLKYFTEQFLVGLIKGMTGAKFGQALGNAITGGIGGAALGGGAAVLSGAGSVAASVAGVEAAALGGGAAAGGGLLGTIGGLATNPFTLAIAGGLGAFFLGKKIFGGGDEASPRRDQFIAQFGPAGTGPGSGFAKLAARLTSLTGQAGGGPLFSALMAAKKHSQFESAQAAIIAALKPLRLKSYRFGGFVPPGATQLAALHGGTYGELVTPLTSEKGAGRNIVINHNIHVDGMVDRENFATVYRDVILPLQKRALTLNQSDVTSTFRRVLEP